MKTSWIKGLWLTLAMGMCVSTSAAPISKDPYIGAMALDARTGAVLYEDGADRPGYPASMLKLMDMFLILDRVQQGSIRLDDVVRVTQEAAAMGGSQVWLDVRESFSVRELLYALMIASANDSAVALAIHVSGSKEAFVREMNAKARDLKLSPVTQFHSPHGLPPGAGQRPDMTTARDFAKLCQALVTAHPEVLEYTSTAYRPFRPDAEKPVEMRTHNPLLASIPKTGIEGCDGLKTGYFSDAGYSIAVTAERNGARVIVVVLGSRDKKTRNAKAAELVLSSLSKASRGTGSTAGTTSTTATSSGTLGTSVQPNAPASETPTGDLTPAEEEAAGDEATSETHSEADEGGGFWKGLAIAVIVLFGIAVVLLAIQRRLLLR